MVNIGLEGMMLMGCYFGIFGADICSSWVLGAVIGMAAGAATGLVHAYFSLHLRANQVVSGTAINLLALGLTGFLFVSHYGDNGTPGTLPQVPNLKLPGIDHIAFFGDAIGNMSVLTWVGLLLVPVVWWFLFRTRAGLRLRAIGEQPRAASTVGLRVIATRYAAVTASGALAALGRRLPRRRLRRLVQFRHDRWPRLHRPGGGDLRQVEPVRRARRRRCCSDSRPRSPTGCRPSRRLWGRCSWRCPTC